MSVRLRKWKSKGGKVLERWTIDVKVTLPGKPPRRIRDFSPVNTRRGAEQHERQVRQALLSGTLDKEVKEVPILEAVVPRLRGGEQRAQHGLREALGRPNGSRRAGPSLLRATGLVAR